MDVISSPEPYQDVLELLQESKYTVLIRQTDDGVVMYIPKGVFTKNKKHVEYDFKLTYNEIDGYGRLTFCDDVLDSKIPLCVVRFFVAFLIITELNSIKYSAEYCTIQDKNGKNLPPSFDYVELLPPFKNNKYLEEEKKISTLLNDFQKVGGRVNGILEQKAKKLGVAEGFKFLTGVLSLN